MKTVVSITGASGVIYGIRLLEVMKGEKHAVVSENGWKVIEAETSFTKKDVARLARIHENDELDSPLASGSFIFDSYIICPCTVSTMSKIACGIADNLVTRIATVALKDRRRFILVLRETPLHTIALENMTRLSSFGVVILPAMPGFYPFPEKVSDMVDFVVGKILDVLQVENDLYKRWEGKKPNRKK